MKQLLFALLSLLFFTDAYSQKLIPFEKKLYKNGLKDAAGNVVVKPIYTEISDNGIHFVLYNSDEGKTSAMSYDGNVIIPPKYKELVLTANKLYYKATGSINFKNVYGFVDFKGNELVPVKYYQLPDYEGQPYMVVKGEHYVYGLIALGNDSVINSYKEIIPPVHAAVDYTVLRDKRLAIEVRDFYNKTAILDINGNIVKDYARYTVSAKSPTADILIVVDEETKKYGLVDPFFKIIAPFEYEFINRFKGNPSYYVTNANRKTGMLDSTGKTLLDPIYNNIYNTEFSKIALNLNGKWGIKDLNGKTIQPLVHDSIDKCAGDYVNLKKGEEWLRINVATGEIQNSIQGYENLIKAFIPMEKKIMAAIDEFADAHAVIRNTKYVPETELAERFYTLRRLKGDPIQRDIMDARKLMYDYLSQFNGIPPSAKNEINGVLEAFGESWTLLDRAYDYKKIVFISKNESIENIINDVINEQGK